MNKETRTICYDDLLHLEAYCFEGVVQAFPNHFHDYYVIGFIESGKRLLSYKGQTCTVSPGSLLLFNPGDSHRCVQCDGGNLSYRCLNIPKATMAALAAEITGSEELPVFSVCVAENQELSGCLMRLHRMILENQSSFEREEALLLFLSSLFSQYASPAVPVPDCGRRLKRVCDYIETNFAEHISLEQLCRYSGLSKSTLLRGFAREKGITPYRYLQAVRVGRAKELLEQGAAPAEAALAVGFSDQSHFSNTFHMFIGLSPAAYKHIFKK